MKQYSQNKKLRFTKINRGSKRPIEKNWVEDNHSWDEIKLWIKKGNNFGVVCGYGDLIVIDSDEPELASAVDKDLSDTFRIKTGGGGTHDYYFCSDIKKKIILQNGKHYGEVQSYGTQVVGAGSLHPSGNKYEIIKDVPIKEISYKQLIKCVKPFMKQVSKEEDYAISEIKDYGESDINNIKITEVLNLSKYKKQSGEYFGANPWHGSSTGMNFWINPQKNVAYCFRCCAGINVAKAIALNNGFISDCGDKLSSSNFRKVLKIAQEDYNLPKRTKQEAIKKSISSWFGYRDLAERFIEEQPIFYDKSKNWWYWDKKNRSWTIIDKVDLLNAINEAAAADTIFHKTRNQILEAMKQVGRTNKPKDANPNWVQFKDTIVNIKTGEKSKATPEYFVTNPIPWELGESEETPNMDRIFAEWVGEENVKMLYQIIAYCTLPNYPIHRLFCFVGGGMNGKSKCIELITRFIGFENVCSTDLDLLMKSRFEITKLHKKLVCQMGETNFNELSKTATLKKLTGQDVIGFEYKNKNPFQDYNYAKILISTNNLPATTDKTVGFYRRWLIIDFPNTFSEKKDILADIPDHEYENLARKCVRILKKLLEERKFDNEGSIEERTKKYEERSDPIKKFLTEETEEDFDGHIFKYDFRKRLNDWCSSHKFRKMTDTAIRKKMLELGIDEGRKYMDWYKNDEVQKKLMRSWLGIKWNEG